MRDIILVNLTDGEIDNGFCFESWEDFYKVTFSPEIVARDIMVLKVTGKTYQERKASLQELAIEYSNTCYPDLSWGELATVNSFFETYGRRYGLLRKFKENAIC